MSQSSVDLSVAHSFEVASKEYLIIKNKNYYMRSLDYASLRSR